MPLTQPHTRSTNKRYFSCSLLCALFLFCLFGPFKASADEVILTTGERFTSSKVWQESDKIRFNMHGLVVSVYKTDVATIIGADGTHRQFNSHVAQDQSPPLPAPPDRITSRTATNEQHPLKPHRPSHSPTPTPTPRSTKPPSAKGKSNGIGHNGMNWLMSPADIKGLELIEKDPAYGGIAQYWRPDEKMKLGQAFLDGIVYGFWRNQLYTITMWAEGRPGYERLHKAVSIRYGQGRRSKTAEDRYVWLDHDNDRMLEFDNERDIGLFWMRSRKLDSRVKSLYPEE